MSKNREIEAKTLLAAPVFQSIKKAYPAHSDFKQANYYFDTPEEVLKKHHISLRVRIFARHAEQTMKVPDLQPVQHKFHEVIEINDPLPLAAAKELVAKAEKQAVPTFRGSVGQYLQQHFSKEKRCLRLFTWSKTHRILATGPQNCELTLDQTAYPDGYQDYELEIENKQPTIIKKVQRALEAKYHFRQTAENSNQNKIGRASKHRAQK